MTYIAMDVHKKRSTLAYWIPGMEGPKIVKCYTTRDEFARVLSEVPEPWVLALESTRQSPAVVKWLRELSVEEIHYANPQELHAFNKGKPKTDVRDAKTMLKLLRMGELPECYLAPPEVEDQRVLSRGRRGFREISTRLRNFVRAVLAQQGLDCEGRDLRGQGAREELEALVEQLSPLRKLVVTLCLTLLDQVEACVSATEAEIEHQVGEDEVAQALMELPGIGIVIAHALRAEMGEIGRFPDPKHLHSYAGLAPKCHDTGDFSGERHLPQRCNKRLRHWAILAAQGAARSRSPSKARRTYQRITKRAKPNVAKVAAARSLMTEVFHRWSQVEAPVPISV
jgi:transposase